MSKSERRKIFCSVLFHLIAIVCMLWSVYVLVKRTVEEIRLGKNGEYIPTTPSIIHQSHAELNKTHLMVLGGDEAVSRFSLKVPWGHLYVKHCILCIYRLPVDTFPRRNVFERQVCNET